MNAFGDMNALGLVPTREAEIEDYKRSWQDKECLDALAALANTRGVVLWVGVQDYGSVVGWEQELNSLVEKKILKRRGAGRSVRYTL